jgi:oligopeptide transport system substrate-binding protein
MMLTRRTALTGSLSLAAAASLAACGGGGRSAGDPATTLHIGNGAEPLSLDPHQASGTWENRIIGDMLIGLTTDDPNGQPVPGMATEWTTSPDGLVWTFKLREAVWSDGAPVTAEDFVFAWRRIMTTTPPAKYASLLFVIKNSEAIYTSAGKPDAVPVEQLGARAIDPLTLEVTLEHPAPYLPGLLTHYTSFPVPKHVIERVGADWIKAENFVGNGPYKLQEWRPNDFVHVVQNERYWDAANICITQAYYYPTSDDTAAERRVRSGALDIQTNFSGARLEEINRTLPGYARIHGYIGLTYYIFNLRREMFQDARVRQALSMALDREFITDEILKGGQRPAYSLVPPGIAMFESGARQVPWAGVPRAERMAQAKALLEQAGYGPDKPLTFKISYRNSGDNPRVIPVAQQNWREIAEWVLPEPEGNEVQINYEKLRQGDFDVGDAGWIADFNDARNFLYLFETRTDQMNYGKYSNPRYDALMAQSDNEPDAERRAQQMKDAEQILLEENGFMPVFFLTNRNLVSPRITGWVDNAVDIHRMRYLCTTDKEPAAAKK